MTAGQTLRRRNPRQDSSGLGFVLSGAGCALAVGAAVGGEPAVALLLTGVALIGAAAALPTRWLLLLSLVLTLWPLTWFSGGIDTRLGVIVIAVVLGVRIVLGAERTRATGTLGWRILILGTVSTASAVWSVQPSESLQAGAALLAMGVVLTAVIPQDAARIEKLILQLAAVLLVVSAVMALTPYGILAGRVRGVFANPNSLAVFVVLLLPLLMTHRRYRPLAALAVLLLLASGSRAGALAAGAQLLVAVIVRYGGRSSGARLAAVLAVAGFAGLAVSVLASSAVDGTATPGSVGYVLRSGDSRSALWQTALSAWRERPLLGFGAGAYPFDTANSYLKLATDLGLIGYLAALPLLLLQARFFWTGSTRVTALTTGAVVGACFEGWMFVGGSAFFLLYWVQIGASHDLDGGGRADATTHADLGRAVLPGRRHAGLLPAAGGGRPGLGRHTPVARARHPDGATGSRQTSS